MKRFKITRGRQTELEICKFFWSKKWKFDNYIHTTQTGKQIHIIKDDKGVSPEEGYFQVNEQGKKEVHTTDPDTLLRLFWGRVWADRCIHELWEPSLACQGADGGIGLYELVDDLPITIAEYAAKKICGGQHYDLIMEYKQKDPKH